MAEWQKLQATYAARQEDLAIFAARQVIQTSGLPQVSQQRLLDRKYASAKEVEDAIESERSYLAALTEGNVVSIGSTPPRGAAITGMRTGMDQIQLAFEALLAGTRPPDGIQPLTGIREMYHLLSGDYELTGLFHGEKSIWAMSTRAPWPTWSPMP